MLAIDHAPLMYYRAMPGEELKDSAGNFDLAANTGEVGPVAGRHRAISYDGTGEFTDLTNHIATLMALDAMTLTFWFRLDSSASQVLFSLDDSASVFPSSDDLFWVQWLSGTGLRTFTRIGASLTLRAIIPGSWDDGEWHHFALATSAAGNAIYMDGQAVTPTYQNGNAASSYLPADANPTADRVRFGSYGVGGSVVGQHLGGAIDKIAIFDQVLSAGQVEDIYEQTGPRFRVLLSIGQSNGLGYNSQTILDGAGQADEPDDRIWQWGRNSFDSGVADGEIIQAELPLHHYTAGKNNVSADFHFAKTLLPRLDEDEQILIVPACKGSTGFGPGDWPQGGTYYEDAEDRFDAAIAHDPLNLRLAVLWNQRESDSTTVDYANAYEGALRDFFTDFMADTGTGQTPWFAFGPTDEYLASGARPAQVSAATISVASEFDNVYYISTVGLPNDNEEGGDGGVNHHAASSQRTMGINAADLWIANLGASLDPSILKPGLVDAAGNLKPGLVNGSYTGGVGTASTLKPGLLNPDGSLKPSLLNADGNLKPGLLKSV